MPKRILGVVVALALVLIAVWWWRGRDRGDVKRSTVAGEGSVGSGVAPRDRGGKAVVDPRTLVTASIAGTVRSVDGVALAGASVCTSWSGPGVVSDDNLVPTCATTGADGSYLLDGLVPARHAVGAGAPTYQPRSWRSPTSDDDWLVLTPGQRRTGIDFALAPGGVLVRGTVEDVSGGPIGGALVSSRAGGWWSGGIAGVVRTDDQGRFAVWVKPGEVSLTAVADGYTETESTVAAPTAKVTMYLTPESSLSGVVLRSDRTPVVGAIVVASDWSAGVSRASARTDDAGRFRLTRLGPGRYKPTASGEGYYGQPAESVLLGLGQSVDGVEIVVASAYVVRGTVMIDDATPTKPCADGWVQLDDLTASRHGSAQVEADGSFAFTAMRPGHYTVRVDCEGFVPRERYDAVDIVDRDLAGLALGVRAGASLRGTARTASGAPVDEARISLRSSGGAARGQRTGGYTLSRPDGSFVLDGLLPGGYTVSASASGERTITPPPTVTVPASGAATLELVFAASGEVGGTVLDSRGAPVAGARVRVSATAGSWGDAALTSDDGSFVVRGVEPGTRRVTASRGWDELRRPGSTDDDRQGQTVTVVAGQRASARLVVEADVGVITGTVKDDRGEPIGDAWLSATRESDAKGAAAGGAMRSGRWLWGSSDRPVITAVDGSFTITELAPGSYTVRAYRRGGGEAAVEHVAVGGTASLVLRTTGAITGTVAMPDGRVPDEFTIDLRDPTTGVSRFEQFYRTEGRFALRELPAGQFRLSAAAAGARASLEVALTSGERKDGVAIALVANLRVRGRFVDLDTKAPVAGLRGTISAVRGGDDMSFAFGPADDAKLDISGDDGRFTLANAPSGLCYLSGLPIDRGSTYSMARWVVEVAGADEVDVGDIPVAKRRLNPGEEPGTFGWRFVDALPDADPRTRTLALSFVEPGGPAATAGLVVGDVITSVDGHDIGGVRFNLSRVLLRVKAGTPVTLGLARGGTVRVTAVADQ